TILYNFLQTRIPFSVLAMLSVLSITAITAFIEFADKFGISDKDLYLFGYTQIAPFTLIILLVFWGAFNRMFNVKESKRLLGSVDQGALFASLISFFSIPLVLNIKGFQVQYLYTIGLVCIIAFTV